MHAIPRLALISLLSWSLSSSCVTGEPKTEPEVREGLYHKDDEPEASKAHALDVARLELSAAQLDANAKDRAAQKAADFAAAEVEQARKELERADRQAAIRAREAENNLKRATVRLEETKGELAELESMYKDEEFAEKTKELVLTRGKSQVEMATAALEVETLRQELLVKEELPAERVKAELALRKAEAALEAAQLEREACALRGKIAVMKAEDAVKKAEAEAAKEG